MTQLSCAKAGIIFTSINPHSQINELEQCLDFGLRGLVISPLIPEQTEDQLLKILPELEGLGDQDFFSSTRFPDLKAIIHTNYHRSRGMLVFAELMQEQLLPESSLLRKVPPFKPSYIANIQTFANSESNLMEAEVYTHQNVLETAENFGKVSNFSLNDRVCSTLSWNTFYGSTLSLWAPMSQGSVIVSPSAEFDPLETLETLQKEYCTVYLGTRDQVEKVFSLSQAQQTSLPNLKNITIIQEGESFDLPQRLPKEVEVTQFAPREGLFFAPNGSVQPLKGIQTRRSQNGTLESNGYHLPPAILKNNQKAIQKNEEWIPSLNATLK